jgi:epoxyqueuosine reductase
MKMIDASSRAIEALIAGGFKAKTVSTNHLFELQERIEKLQKAGFLDPLLTETYLQFKYAEPAHFPNGTVFIISIHQPITRATLVVKGKEYSADIPPTYIGKPDDTQVEITLNTILKDAGFMIKRARLPVKTLAVSTGLAKYGKNNITYVPGFGSYHRLVAFISDCPPSEDNWVKPEVMKACQTCFKCGDNCPTHCISRERFLLHAENCLTWYNERAVQIPDWIQPSWHNSVVGCMSCQIACPVKRQQIDQIVAGPRFTEVETSLLLQGTPVDRLPTDTRSKVTGIAMDDSEEILARNLRLIIGKNESLYEYLP